MATSVPILLATILVSAMAVDNRRLHQGSGFPVDNSELHQGNVSQAAAALATSQRKPPKFLRSASDMIVPRERTKITDTPCGVTMKMTSKSDKDEGCPAECPFYAQNRKDDDFCTFVCVQGSECPSWNPNKPIPDEKLGACRAPMVEHCRVHNLDGTDTCKQCQSLYALHSDGTCHYNHFWILYILLAVLITVVVTLGTWVTDCCMRPETNEFGVKEGSDFRSAQKIRVADGEGRRGLWDLTTNLTEANVAGPGMLLHFNFQRCIIIWAAIVASIWVAIALLVDTDLFVLGTRKFGTPRNNCILVAWGYETQQRLMWTKVTFLAIVYAMSFILSILYGISQLRKFQSFDFSHKTSKDFTAICSGLPPLPGADKVEDTLTKSLAHATGQAIVGVSICWNYSENEEMVDSHLKKEIDSRVRTPRPAGSSADALAETGAFRQKLLDIETSLLGPEEQDAEATDANLEEVLKTMVSSEHAFVVFESEHARDAAVNKVSEEGGFEFQGRTVELGVQECEPDTVQWQNFDDASVLTGAIRLLKGFGLIFCGLTFWTCVFYAPYTWSVLNFNYDNGNQPGPVYGIAFSLIVTVGNVIMYEICLRVSVFLGFKYGDQREASYMILYTIACTFNILMDMVTTYFLALYIMRGLDFRTYHGQRLDDISDFNEQFETYAIQRSLAENTFAYAFPSTYLIPFLIEPIVTIYVPWQLGYLLVRSHPEIVGRDAEEWLACVPMDLGRYADILLNMLLGVLIFYFPGGYTHKLFYAMAASQIYIYAFDQWKVLRGIPSITYASYDIEWCAQALFAPICAVMLSCLVFKANCQHYGFCISGWHLTETCITAFIAHCLVHLLVLKYVVPCFGIEAPENSELDEITYEKHHARQPYNFFNTNPVHCLRSAYVYNHQPPCMYVETGREHYIQPNPALGCHFDGAVHGRTCGDDHDEYSTTGLMRTLTKVKKSWTPARLSSQEP